MQLISQMGQIWESAGLTLWTKPYEIIATGPNCGLIEAITDSMSIHAVKEKVGPNATLRDYFTKEFGDVKSDRYKKARDNFCNSLAAYSLITYILQVKDRHNGNIMIDMEGHLSHIDFGFLLSNAPGKGFSIEKDVPFKLTQEMVDVLGGDHSKKFNDFRQRMALGFMALQENAERIIILVEMMLNGQSELPCFIGGRALVRELKERLFPNMRRLSANEAQQHVDELIAQSNNNWRTRCYDKF